MREAKTVLVVAVVGLIIYPFAAILLPMTVATVGVRSGMALGVATTVAVIVWLAIRLGLFIMIGFAVGKRVRVDSVRYAVAAGLITTIGLIIYDWMSAAFVSGEIAFFPLTARRTVMLSGASLAQIMLCTLGGWISARSESL
jgi:hypothetical protein